MPVRHFFSYCDLSCGPLICMLTFLSAFCPFIKTRQTLNGDELGFSQSCSAVRWLE